MSYFNHELEDKGAGTCPVTHKPRTVLILARYKIENAWLEPVTSKDSRTKEKLIVKGKFTNFGVQFVEEDDDGQQALLQLTAFEPITIEASPVEHAGESYALLAVRDADRHVINAVAYLEPYIFNKLIEKTNASDKIVPGGTAIDITAQGVSPVTSDDGTTIYNATIVSVVVNGRRLMTEAEEIGIDVVTSPRPPSPTSIPKAVSVAMNPTVSPQTLPALHAEIRKMTELDAGPGLTCPRCKSDMVVRIARVGPNLGDQFFGCSKFPDCRGTRPLAYVERNRK